MVCHVPGFPCIDFWTELNHFIPINDAYQLALTCKFFWNLRSERVKKLQIHDLGAGNITFQLQRQCGHYFSWTMGVFNNSRWMFHLEHGICSTCGNDFICSRNCVCHHTPWIYNETPLYGPFSD